MARLWKQIRPGTRLLIDDWPAGTLPSAESMQSVGFLNQFIGWMRYIGNFTWTDESHYPTWPDRGTAKFLVGGENIQRASFWNAIRHFNPLDETADFAGHIWMDYNPSDICETMQTFENGALLGLNEDYLAAIELTDWIAGDIIHPSSSDSCPVRNMLLNLRTRLDLCRVVCLGRPNILGQYDDPIFDIGYYWNYANKIECLRQWTISSSNSSYPSQPPYVGSCYPEDELDDDKRPIALYLSSSSPSYGYTDWLTDPLIVGRMANGIEDCPHGLLVACTTFQKDSRGPANPVYVYPANYDLALWYSETDVDPTGVGVSAGTVGGYGSWAGGTACSYGNAYCFYALLLDELPDNFKPST